jgi:uncharacterized protein GlcG (DUF336 family)
MPPRAAHVSTLLVALVVAGAAGPAGAGADCGLLPDHGRLRQALADVKEGKDANSGMGNQEWAATVDRDGIVCAVVFSGPDRGAEWPGSRLIAAEKASTANAVSAPNYALSTGNLWAASQPGESLFGLVTTAPPNPATAFAGDPKDFGQPSDPLVGKPIGGIVVFAGGLPLYDARGRLVGALGVSGDTSCADHVIAWKVRHALALDAVPMGPAPGGNDNVILDVATGRSPSGFGHPSCKGGKPADDILKQLPDKYRPGPK